MIWNFTKHSNYKRYALCKSIKKIFICNLNTCTHRRVWCNHCNHANHNRCSRMSSTVYSVPNFLDYHQLTMPSFSTVTDKRFWFATFSSLQNPNTTMNVRQYKNHCVLNILKRTFGAYIIFTHYALMLNTQYQLFTSFHSTHLLLWSCI